MSEMTTEKFETYAKNAGEPRWFTEKRSAAFFGKGLVFNKFTGSYKIYRTYKNTKEEAH